MTLSENYLQKKDTGNHESFSHNNRMVRLMRFACNIRKWLDFEFVQGTKKVVILSGSSYGGRVLF